MNTLETFLAAQTAYNAQLSTALADISAQVATLNSTIASLQGSDNLTPEDAATVATLTTQGAALVSSAQALDTTPPAPPVAPPAPTPVPDPAPVASTDPTATPHA